MATSRIAHPPELPTQLMEMLKGLVPENLKQQLSVSTADDLPPLCDSLLRVFHESEVFQEIIGDLAIDPENGLCGKKEDTALELKQQGNRCFLAGDCANALVHYSQALQVAPINAVDIDKSLVAVLYANRASVLHKMHLQLECMRDCNRAIQMSPAYAKAWYKRGRANIAMGNFDDAVCDFQIAKTLEISSSGKKQIEEELKVLQLHKGSNLAVDKGKNKSDEPIPVKPRVSTSNKGRGMVSRTEIPPSSLVYTEEPYALIILKHCRETHCHYCLNELPADKVPCPSCSISLYCSRRCQIQAGGLVLPNFSAKQAIGGYLSDRLRNYAREITLGSFAGLSTEDFPEHRHECDGVHWPVILPSEIVLAGRILAKIIVERGFFADDSSLGLLANLMHHFSRMDTNSKMECFIYSIILAGCLQGFYPSRLPLRGKTIALIVILIAQIKVNSLSIVRMKSSGMPGSPDQCAVPNTCTMEQVKVGQAIYLTGSLFNHSCKPNVHVYFNSRNLFIRATEFVQMGDPLELSYGPQVGQFDCKDRLKCLEDEYFFRCQCSGCSVVNVSDLVLNAFCCNVPDCSGVVLDNTVFDCEREKNINSLSSNDMSMLEPFMQSDNFHNGSPGNCLKCGSYYDLKSSHETVDEAWANFTRLQEELNLNRVSKTTLAVALRSLVSMKSTLHAYNRRIAEAEDKLSQAFCLLGNLKLAAMHCQASIQILEKLYGENHIAIGNELLKFCSIQLALGDTAAVESIKRVNEIYMCYYGSHARTMFPFLNSLEEEARKIVTVQLKSLLCS